MPNKNKNTEVPQCVQTDVSSSTFISNVPNKFADCVKKYHKEFNVKLKEFKEYKGNWKTVHVVGKMSDLILLNAKCEKETYGDLDDVD